MKAYQGLHEGEAFFIMAPAGWHIVQAEGLPEFCELCDGKGARVALLRNVDIQKLPATDKVPTGRAVGAS